METLGREIWKEFKLELEQTGHWKIGPLKLWITRLYNEWRIVDIPSRDHLERSIQIELPYLNSMPEEKSLKRFSVAETCEKLRFVPILGDRSMVVRPEVPFYILENEKIDLYMSTSLWLKIESADKGKQIVELPIYRPSDTWFGEDTINGELCYAAKISARLKFSDLHLSNYRAVTKITIKNAANEPFFLERIKLPVVNLSLYKSETNHFFTDNIQVIRENIEGKFKLHIDKPAKKDFGKLEKIAGAKKPLGESFFSRTIKSLIS